MVLLYARHALRDSRLDLREPRPACRAGARGTDDVRNRVLARVRGPRSPLLALIAPPNASRYPSLALRHALELSLHALKYDEQARNSTSS